MASGVVKDYRKLLRHLKGFPSTMAPKSEFRILVTKVNFHCIHRMKILKFDSYGAILKIQSGVFDF
jgi:hypothetical protein